VLEHPIAKPLLPYIPTRVKDQLGIVSNEARLLASEYEPASLYLTKYGQSFKHTHGSFADISQNSDFFKELDLKVSARMVDMMDLSPLSPQEWVQMRDKGGVLTKSETEIKAIIFERGVYPDIRNDVWRFLLGIVPWTSSEVERSQRLTEKWYRISVFILRNSYTSIKSQWQEILGDFLSNHFDEEPQEKTSSAWDESDTDNVVAKIIERKNRIMKDVVRTDREHEYFGGSKNGITMPLAESPGGSIMLPRNLQMLQNILLTYTMVDFDLGYVQGMNDLASPILLVLNSESEAFWGFSTFMDRIVLCLFLHCLEI
jgi:hypothetical protein